MVQFVSRAANKVTWHSLWTGHLKESCTVKKKKRHQLTEGSAFRALLKLTASLN